MFLRATKVTAENAEEARKKAAGELRTVPSNLQIADLGNGEYQAAFIHADADAEIVLSESGLEARIAQYLPPLGEGKPLTVEALKKKMALAGILFGVDDAAIAQAVQAFAKGEDAAGVVIAKGMKSVSAQNAYIQTFGDLTKPFLPGMRICRFMHSQEAATGMTVRGEMIAPPKTAPPRDLKLSIKDGAMHSEETDEILSTTYGLATVSGGEVSVKPAFSVSADGLEVRATIHRFDGESNEITSERLEEVFTGFGFVHGFDKAACDQALAGLEAVEVGKPSPCVPDVLIMKGDLPRDGRDERLELAPEEPKKAGAVDERARIDYRVRGGVLNASAGQVLGQIHPPEPGVPGKNIRGDVMPAADGRPTNIQIGQNVTVVEGGNLVSAIDGILLYTHNTVNVTEVLDINGDISYETGNIRIDKGSLRIKGTIRDGFTVDVAGSIIVGEAIEGAFVHSGGDIEVRGGLLMHGGGKIAAEGSLFALFAENAAIEVEKDVVIANDIANCSILARGKITAMSGKGKIMGGTLSAGIGVEANEVGSELGVTTSVILGIEPSEQKELLEERRVLNSNLERIQRVVGDGSPRDILLNTPPPKRKAMLSLLKARLGALQRLDALKHKLVEIDAQRRVSIQAGLMAHKTIYPGVRVTIAGLTYEVKQQMSHCRIYYDRESESIRLGS
ncbi:MAG: FapA family protein [Planctomycetota bacterium]